MSLALPGYVDTGITGSVTTTATVRLLMHTIQQSLKIGSWTLIGTASIDNSVLCPNFPPDQFTSHSAYASIPEFCVSTLVDFIDYQCHDGTGEMTQDLDFAETTGPWRLGVRIELIGTTEYPQFAQHYKITYKWFGDENTKRETSLGSASAVTGWWNPTGMGPGWNAGWQTTPNPGMTPVERGLYDTVVFGCILEAVAGRPFGYSGATFRSMTINGVSVDTSGLDDGILLGVGSGSANGSGTGGGTQGFQPSWALAYDVDVLKATNGVTTAAEVVTENNGTIVCPYTGTLYLRQVSWDAAVFTGNEKLTIDTDWAADQTVPWDVDDLQVLIWANPALEAPTSGGQSYLPVAVDLLAELSVIVPDGSPVLGIGIDSSWSLTLGAVGTDAPAWRKWLGVGTLGHAEPSFNPDLESRTKHAAGEYVWDWSSYAYLWIRLAQPSDVASTTATLRVRGVYAVVTDNHETGSSRPNAFAVSQIPFVATYEFTADMAGVTVNHLVDLHFPTTASVNGVDVNLSTDAPFYLGRVDDVLLTLETNAILWTMERFSLSSEASPAAHGGPGVAHLKLDFGAPVQREDYDALHAAHNGAACMSNLGDRTACTELFSQDGRAVRAFSYLTGAGTGTILDAQLSLEEFVGWLDQIEGWSAVYDSAAYEAANQDGFGNSLGPELAQWLRPEIGGKQFVPGAGCDPQANPMVRELWPAAGATFAIYTRQVLGHGALEALLSAEGVRAGPSISVVTSPATAPETTDPHGYVNFEAVPANGLVAYSLVAP